MADFSAATTGQDAFTDVLTFSHTTSGADRLLLVGVTCVNATISSVTYNGVGMTAVESGGASIRLYALVAPATGANNVVVTLSTDEAVCAVAASYTGVDQTTGYNGVQSSATGDGSPSLTVTSAAGNLVVGMSGIIDNSGLTPPVHTVGAGQTSRGNLAEGGVYMMLSDEAGDTSVTHSYTRAGAFYYEQRIIAINLIAAGGGGGSAVPAKMRSYRQRRS
jgi:hypothetical protein